MLKYLNAITAGLRTVILYDELGRCTLSLPHTQTHNTHTLSLSLFLILSGMPETTKLLDHSLFPLVRVSATITRYTIPVRTVQDDTSNHLIIPRLDHVLIQTEITELFAKQRIIRDNYAASERVLISLLDSFLIQKLKFRNGQLEIEMRADF